MPVTKIKSKWESGDLVFRDTNGDKVQVLSNDVGNRIIAKVALTAGLVNSIALAWQNPESSKIIVDKVELYLTTAGGTATAVIDVGVVADAASTADTLIDGLDVNQTGIFDNITDKGTNGKSRQVVDEKGGTNDYITGKILTEAAAGLVGYAYITYFTV